MKLTEKIAEYIYSFNCELPQENLDKAKIHLIDTFACIVCGTAEASANLIIKYLNSSKIANGAEIIFQTNLQVKPADAALYYGVCAHNCDSDDLSKTLGGHPGAVILPVILGLGSAKKTAGKRALHAYIAGVETASVIGRGFLNTSFNTNLNQTTVLGILGGVAAASIMLDLSKNEIIAALGIAASEASGLKINYGSTAKDIAVGNASSKAILSAELAQIGVDADSNSLGAETGFFRTLASDFKAEIVEDAIDNKRSDFFDPGIILKPYPTCRGIHNGIDGALYLKSQHEISPSKINSITCHVQDTVVESNRYPIPGNPPQGKFSLGYCIALALLNGKVTVDDFVEEGELDRNAIEIANTIGITVDNDFTRENAKGGITLTINMNDGESYTHTGYYAKGDPNNPMTDSEHKQKIMHCLTRRMNEKNADTLLDRLGAVECSTIDEILHSCCP